MGDKNELEAGAENRSFDDKDVATELSPVQAAGNVSAAASNVNYLAKYVTNVLRTSGVAPLTSASRLANSRDWQISAEAYMRLASDWPNHYRTISQNWSLAKGDGIYGIARVGEELQDFVSNITLVQTGEGRKANRKLFQALLDSYKAKAQAYKRPFEKWGRWS